MSAVTSGESGFRHLLERKLGKRNLTLDLLGNAMEDRSEIRQLKVCSSWKKKGLIIVTVSRAET